MRNLRDVFARWLTLALMSLLCPLAGRAQTLTTGAIAGDVTDPTGASVPNATVTATNMVPRRSARLLRPRLR